MTTLVEHTVVKSARKQHCCDWCYESIPVGSSYHHSRIMENGEAWTYRDHLECNEAFCRLPRHEQDEAHLNGPYTRGCTCVRGDESCDDPKHPVNP